MSVTLGISPRLGRSVIALGISVIAPGRSPRPGISVTLGISPRLGRAGTPVGDNILPDVLNGAGDLVGDVLDGLTSAQPGLPSSIPILPGLDLNAGGAIGGDAAVTLPGQTTPVLAVGGGTGGAAGISLPPVSIPVIPTRPGSLLGGLFGAQEAVPGDAAVDPITGFPIDPITGFPKDPNTGGLYDPITGLPLLIDRATGFPVDPSTGYPFDPSTGIPVLPTDAAGLPIIPSIIDTVDQLVDPILSAVDAVIDPLTSILGPGDFDLLNTDPGFIAKTLNDAAQYLSPNDPNVPGWQEFGCFTSTDLFGGTLIQVAAEVLGASNSPQLCIDACATQGQDYSSVIGDECYCSSVPPPTDAGSTKCDTACSGDPTLLCGNPTDGGFNVFKRLITLELPVPLPLLPAPSGLQYSGCFFANAFIAAADFVIQNVAGIEACAASANGYQYAGIQGTSCYLSNTPPALDLEAGIGLCSTACSGNVLESCGGIALPINVGAGLTELVTLYSTAPAPPTTEPPTPDTDVTGPTGPGGWYNNGCVSADVFVLDALFNGLQISYAEFTPVDNNGERCVNDCALSGFNYALTQGATCYCSNNAPTTPADSQLACNQPCPNNPEERCGGIALTVGVDGGILGNLYSIIAPLLGQVRLIISFVKMYILCSVAKCSMLCRVPALARTLLFKGDEILCSALRKYHSRRRRSPCSPARELSLAIRSS